MEVISKDKAKGKAHGTEKRIKKAARLVKEKDDKRRTEHKRQNAEARKERAIETAYNEKVADVEILGFTKGILTLLIEGKQEKRSLSYGRRNADIADFVTFIADFELKLYGDMVKLKYLKNFNEMKDTLVWAISAKA